MTRRKRVSKAAGDAPGTQRKKTIVNQLTDMECQFVSMVPAGANRQKSFLVVKADGTPAVDPASPAAVNEKVTTCPACGAAIDGSPAACPACGAPLTVDGAPAPRPPEDEDEVEITIKAPVDATPASPVVDPKVAEAANDGGPPGAADGGSPSSPAGADLSGWLEAAGANVDAMLLELRLQPAPAQPSAPMVPPPVPPAPEVQKIGKGDRGASVEEAHAEAARARAELRKAEVALLSERARVARLSKGVHFQVGLPTGEVSAAAAVEKDDRALRAFRSGGDMTTVALKGAPATTGN